MPEWVLNEKSAMMPRNTYQNELNEQAVGSTYKTKNIIRILKEAHILKIC